MIQQAEDFRAESEALYALLEPIDPAAFDEPTQFKDWTINAVLQHLYFWNQMAGYQITDEVGLAERLKKAGGHKGGMRGFENESLGGLSGRPLLEAWRANVDETADTFAAADPKARLKWAGPDMSARSSITARLMETWAHGQEVYDHLGVERVNADRIKNIAHLGVSTYGWTYMTRGRKAPSPAPYVKLTAPSGETWEWNRPDPQNMVSGDAADFCQVVTQVRNIADTALETVGETASEWMSMAQCFAGPPEPPPAPGTRRKRAVA